MALGCYGNRSGHHSSWPQLDWSVSSMWLHHGSQCKFSRHGIWLFFGQVLIQVQPGVNKRAGHRVKTCLPRHFHVSGPMVRITVSLLSTKLRHIGEQKVELPIMPRDKRHKLGLSWPNQGVYSPRGTCKKEEWLDRCTRYISDVVEQNLVENLLEGRKCVLCILLYFWVYMFVKKEGPSKYLLNEQKFKKLQYVVEKCS